MKDDLLAGSKSAFFCLLLILLPNLEWLCFWDPHSAVVMTQEQRDPQSGSLALSRLKTIELQHDDIEDGEDIMSVLSFAALPCVRKLCGHMVTGTLESLPDTDDCLHSEASDLCPAIKIKATEGPDYQLKLCVMWPYAEYLSNVETLYFTYSNISSEKLDLLLPAFKNHKACRYTDGGTTVGDEPFLPLNMVRALLTHQGRSFEYLRVRDCVFGGRPTYVESLSELQALKKVELKMSLLSRTSRDEPASASDKDVTEAEVQGKRAVIKFVDFLPSSVEEFTIILPMPRTGVHLIAALKEMFEGFVERHSEQLPNLRRMRLVSKRPRVVNLWEKMGRDARIEAEILLNEGTKTDEVAVANIADFLKRRTDGETLKEGDPV